MRSSVPPQVCSISSGCAAIASRSIICLPVDVSSRKIALARTHQLDKQHSGDEPADMSEPRHPLIAHVRMCDRTRAAKELGDEPVHQNERGRDIHHGDEEVENQRMNVRSWKLDQI